jgi:hypothetical protein
MNIEQALLKEHTKSQTLAIQDEILRNPALFDELWELIKSGTPPVPQRGAWVISHLGEVNPDLLKPYFADVLVLLRAPTHDAVHRALVRTLAHMDIPEEYEGELYDLAISWISSPVKPVAIRVHCMDIAARIARPYPELQDELRQVIEAQMSWGSAGYKSRGKRVIKSLKKA